MCKINHQLLFFTIITTGRGPFKDPQPVVLVHGSREDRADYAGRAGLAIIPPLNNALYSQTDPV